MLRGLPIVNLTKDHSLKLLFFISLILPFAGNSQQLANNKQVVKEHPEKIIERQKNITRQISGLVDFVKTQFTQIATQQDQLQEKNSRLQSLTKQSRTLQEENAFQNLKKEIADLQSSIAKLNAEREETGRRISAFQKELVDAERQLKEFAIDEAASLYSRVQLLLDTLPPSARKLSAEENNTLLFYYDKFKTSPLFAQKVKQNWKANQEAPDNSGKDKVKLSPEIQQAVLDRIKQQLKELDRLKAGLKE